MKVRLFFMVLICTAQLTMAQNLSLLSFGISSDFLAVPLTKNSLQSNNTTVHLNYNLNNNLNFKIGYENSMIKENQNKKYTDLSGLIAGLGYFFNSTVDSKFNTELFASYTNVFKGFTSFENFHGDLGIRFYFKRMFFIGTAIRYSKNDLLISPNSDNLNWYWQMGIQIPILKI